MVEAGMNTVLLSSFYKSPGTMYRYPSSFYKSPGTMYRYPSSPFVQLTTSTIAPLSPPSRHCQMTTQKWGGVYCTNNKSHIKERSSSFRGFSSFFFFISSRYVSSFFRKFRPLGAKTKKSTVQLCSALHKLHMHFRKGT